MVELEADARPHARSAKQLQATSAQAKREARQAQGQLEAVRKGLEGGASTSDVRRPRPNRRRPPLPPRTRPPLQRRNKRPRRPGSRPPSFLCPPSRIRSPGASSGANASRAPARPARPPSRTASRASWRRWAGSTVTGSASAPTARPMAGSCWTARRCRRGASPTPLATTGSARALAVAPGVPPGFAEGVVSFPLSLPAVHPNQAREVCDPLQGASFRRLQLAIGRLCRTAIPRVPSPSGDRMAWMLPSARWTCDPYDVTAAAALRTGLACRRPRRSWFAATRGPARARVPRRRRAR